MMRPSRLSSATTPMRRPSREGPGGIPRTITAGSCESEFTRRRGGEPRLRRRRRRRGATNERIENICRDVHSPRGACVCSRVSQKTANGAWKTAAAGCVRERASDSYVERGGEPADSLSSGSPSRPRSLAHAHVHAGRACAA